MPKAKRPAKKKAAPRKKSPAKKRTRTAKEFRADLPAEQTPKSVAKKDVEESNPQIKKHIERVERMMGRPTKYRPEMLRTVLLCSVEGESIVEICAELGITRETYNQWCKSNPDFSDAHKKGRILAESWWREVGRHAAVGALNFPSVGHYCLLVSNMFGINQKTESEVTGALGIKHELEDLPDDALNKATDALLEAIEKKSGADE